MPSSRTRLLAARSVTRGCVPLAGYRLAVARTNMLDGLDPAVARAFERSLKTLRDAGAHIEEIPLHEIRDLGSIQATGGFAAAESYAWHRNLLARKADGYDPRVRAAHRTRRRHEGPRVHRTHPCAARLDCPRGDGPSRLRRGAVAHRAHRGPAHRPGRAGCGRDEEFFRVNALLLRNPSVVNMLDGCAISIPCHVPGELPIGLMIWQSAMRDDTVLNIALQAEAALA